MIEGINLKKSYGKKQVLGGTSFEIREGEIVGLYGPNGSGKTTLTRLLCGLVRPDEGEIRMDGKLLVSAKTRYDRRAGMRIQPVYQQPQAALDPVQKIEDGFYEIIRFHHLAKNRQEAEAMIRAILRDVGLPWEIVRHLPHQISGGEAQRVCMARALLFSPRLLILDEATSMLDVSTQANVLGMIRRVMEERGGSILFITHDETLARYYSHRFISL